MMKESIISTGGRFSTSRMVLEYTEKFYMPLANLYNTYYKNLDSVAQFDKWKKELYNSWEKIKISQDKGNLDNITMDAGNNIEVKCNVKLPNISVNNIEVQTYYGRIQENGVVDDISIIPMKLIEKDEKKNEYTYSAKINLINGGNYGYTFFFSVFFYKFNCNNTYIIDNTILLYSSIICLNFYICLLKYLVI